MSSRGCCPRDLGPVLGASDEAGHMVMMEPKQGSDHGGVISWAITIERPGWEGPGHLMLGQTYNPSLQQPQPIQNILDHVFRLIFLKNTKLLQINPLIIPNFCNRVPVYSFSPISRGSPYPCLYSPCAPAPPIQSLLTHTSGKGHTLHFPQFVPPTQPMATPWRDKKNKYAW